MRSIGAVSNDGLCRGAAFRYRGHNILSPWADTEKAEPPLGR
jgi:hypothetical protein